MKFRYLLIGFILFFIGCGGGVSNEAVVNDNSLKYSVDANGTVTVSGIFEIKTDKPDYLKDINVTATHFQAMIDGGNDCIISYSPTYTDTYTGKDITVNFNVQLKKECATNDNLRFTYDLYMTYLYPSGLVEEKHKTKVFYVYKKSPVYIPLDVNATMSPYALSFKVPIDKLQLNSKYNLVFDIYDLKGNIISPSKMKNFNVTSFKHLFDIQSISFDNNDIILGIQTHTKAGVDALKVSFDYNGKTIQTGKTLTILSGPPHTFSLVFVRSDFNTTTGIFHSKYYIFATDKYSNPVNNNEYVFKIHGISSIRKDDKGYIINRLGDIENGNGVTTFTSKDSDFENSNILPEDMLAILPNPNYPNDTSYAGVWIIDNILNNNSLILKDDYEGSKKENLKFLIGNEKLYNYCSSQYEGIKTKSFTENYEYSNGKTFVDVAFPPFLAGHKVYLGVSVYDKNAKRVNGSVLSTVLLTHVKFIKSDPSSWSANNTGVVSFKFTVWNGSVDEYDVLTPAHEIQPLQDADFTKNDFVTVPYGCANFELTKANTGCDGVVQIRITSVNDTNTSCSIQWNGTIGNEEINQTSSY